MRENLWLKITFLSVLLGTSRNSSVSSSCQETDGETDTQEPDDTQQNNLQDQDDKGTQLPDISTKADFFVKEYRIREEIKRQYSRFGRFMQESERQNAQEFVKSLETLVPELGQMLDITEVDHALQQFAAEFCTGNSSPWNSIRKQFAVEFCTGNSSLRIPPQNSV